MKILFVAGNWAENIKPSGYASKLNDVITHIAKNYMSSVEFHNGGTFDELGSLVDRVVDFDIVMWFANVPNTYEKRVGSLKEINPKMILVTSKNNLDDRYTRQHLVARMLKVKANLCVEFNRSADGSFVASVLDPLGNSFCEKAPNIGYVGSTLIHRAMSLMTFMRMGSTSVGAAKDIPDQPEFFEHARSMGDVVHNLIHPESTDRFLGNLSFRCERGFPSFRDSDYIYVSRRNIDKRFIDKGGFVAVEPQLDAHGVRYYGEAKPSVDTPVQVRLYQLYPAVRYMMHSHVYIDGAPMTKKVIPCGAMNEIADIIETVIPSKEITNFSINLKGHGSIVFADSIEYIKSVKYYARPIPELQDNYIHDYDNVCGYINYMTSSGVR